MLHVLVQVPSHAGMPTEVINLTLTLCHLISFACHGSEAQANLNAARAFQQHLQLLASSSRMASQVPPPRLPPPGSCIGMFKGLASSPMIETYPQQQPRRDGCEQHAALPAVSDMSVDASCQDKSPVQQPRTHVDSYSMQELSQPVHTNQHQQQKQREDEQDVVTVSSSHKELLRRPSSKHQGGVVTASSHEQELMSTMQRSAQQGVASVPLSRCSNSSSCSSTDEQPHTSSVQERAMPTSTDVSTTNKLVQSDDIGPAPYSGQTRQQQQHHLEQPQTNGHKQPASTHQDQHKRKQQIKRQQPTFTASVVTQQAPSKQQAPKLQPRSKTQQARQLQPLQQQQLPLMRSVVKVLPPPSFAALGDMLTAFGGDEVILFTGM